MTISSCRSIVVEDGSGRGDAVGENTDDDEGAGREVEVQFDGLCRL